MQSSFSVAKTAHSITSSPVISVIAILRLSELSRWCVHNRGVVLKKKWTTPETRLRQRFLNNLGLHLHVKKLPQRIFGLVLRYSYSCLSVCSRSMFSQPRFRIPLPNHFDLLFKWDRTFPPNSSPQTFPPPEIESLGHFPLPQFTRFLWWKIFLLTDDCMSPYGNLITDVYPVKRNTTLCAYIRLTL